MNLYGFVGNCPMSRVDRFGLMSDDSTVNKGIYGFPQQSDSWTYYIDGNDGYGTLNLFFQQYLSTKAGGAPYDASGVTYSKSVWNGIMQDDRIQGFIQSDIIAKVKKNGHCCSKAGELISPENIVSPRSSFWKVLDPGTLDATLAIGSGELYVNSGSWVVKCDKGECWWQARLSLTVKDLYSFRSYSDKVLFDDMRNDSYAKADASKPWYTVDNNLPFRLLAFDLLGREFWVKDTRDIWLRGRFACGK